ncbi:TPA: LuxR family transcriptional regulator [Streptococcus suis]|nr:LuxR family transcriptional regulator [Streptococcus suis]
MEELIYIYNVSLIILYTMTLTFSILKLLKGEKYSRSLYAVISLYLLFFIFDNLILSMTEIITQFGIRYNQASYGVPILKTIIFLVNNTCQIWIISKIRHEKMSYWHYFLILLIFIWMLIPLTEPSALRTFLYYLPNQLLLIYTGFISNHNLAKTNISITRQHYLKIIAYIAIVSGILIILEDAYVIFQVDSYDLSSLRIQNRSFTEDLFSIVICVLIFNYLLKQSHSNIVEEFHITKTIELDKADLFFSDYHLTDREKEIAHLLLKHKHNQEIADQLYLSIGTVKTHIHNIYLKMDITKRNQFFELYEAYEG